MKTHLRVLGEELLDGRRLVGGEIIEHDVNFTRPFGFADQFGEECDEIGAGGFGKYTWPISAV